MILRNQCFGSLACRVRKVHMYLGARKLGAKIFEKFGIYIITHISTIEIELSIGSWRNHKN